MKAERLPHGWLSATLDDVAKWGSGGTPSRKLPRFFNGSIPWFKTGELGPKTIVSAEEHITEEAIKKSSAKIFPKGSVGIAMYGATIGKLSIWGIDASTNQACAVAQPYDFALSNVFLYYFLLSEKRNLINSGKGGAQPNISQGILKEWPIWLPPFNEQIRIVAKIEELFSELDKGIENLKTAREQLKVYRQAVLKHAFEGKLTAQWREENKDKLETADQLLARIQKEREARYLQQIEEWKAAVKTWEEKSKPGKKPTKPKKLKIITSLTEDEIVDLPELPTSWAWEKLGELSLKITDGEHFRPPVQKNGVYFLSAKDIRESGISLDDPLYIDKEMARKARLRCNPDRGDILIVSRGATVGRMSIVNIDEEFCLLGSVILIKAAKDMDSSFLIGALRSPRINRTVVSSSGATAQQAIYLRDVQHVAIPVCSLEEQREISKILDEKLSISDVFGSVIEREYQRIEVLRQSILKKAFCGQLVEQDPGDEPASALLERIKVGKAKQTKPAKKKKRKTAA